MFHFHNFVIGLQRTSCIALLLINLEEVCILSNTGFPGFEIDFRKIDAQIIGSGNGNIKNAYNFNYKLEYL